MAGSRKSAAPYAAQLRKLVAGANGARTFSAATLAETFELRPKEERRTTVNQIHQALRQAWEAGEIVAYVDADGDELREPEFCVNGSPAVQHPQIFGLPGQPSPVDGYTPTGYEAQNARTAEPDPSAAADGGGEPPVDEPGRGAAIRADDGEDAAGEAVAEYSVEACVEQIEAYRVDEPAPEWLPDRLLVHLVRLPNVVRM